jgi:hypothetical protein
MKEQTIQELWALPTNMKELPYDFHGYKLYSSNKLKVKFFEAVLATDWGKYHAKNFKRLLTDGYVVPTFMDKGLLSFLSKRFKRDWTKNVQGLYSEELDKVLVFIDNNSNWLGISSNKNLVKTTLHELMHLSASKNMAGFFRIMQPTFQKYYSSYFSDIFSCQEKLNVDAILKSLYNTEGRYSKALHTKYMTAIMDTIKPKTSLDEQEYDYIFKDIFLITSSFAVNPMLLMRYYSRFYHIFGPLNDAYTKTFKKRNSYTSPSQELWALSEVAAVMVELLPVDKRVGAILTNIK